MQLNTAGMMRMLAPFGLPRGTRVLVAVSGGADSMALLTLLAQSADTSGLQVGVVHINHQLRPSAGREAALVQAYAQQLDVPCTVVAWPVAAHPANGVEAAARAFRYTTFARVAQNERYPLLMTAHNLDDQAETVLFRLARSGSVRGVSGIPADTVQYGLRVVRPLLSVHKAALQAYCEQQGITFVHDESNDDTRYSRNYLRHTVLPLLRDRWPDTDRHFARLATELTGLRTLADVTLRHLSGKVRLKSDEFTWQNVQNESTTVQKLLLQHLLTRWYPPISERQVLAVLNALTSPDGRQRIVTLSPQLALVVQHGQVRRQPRGADVQAADVVLTALDRWVSGVGGAWALLTQRPVAGDHVLATATGWPLPVTVRHRQPGDWVRLARGQHQKLGRLLTNNHVPVVVRDHLWVAARGHEVLWVENTRPGQLFHAGQTAKIKAQLVFRPDDGGSRDEF
ncbi:tRNA lysidine(34) synthetase TilS [Lacticaseibacillus thailandensis]|uniref:tRNA lysidine(34) synthetase TilS n=1 Tax=Lacticaseibacillus thailandensis TaxID=381741 RepID=UPI0007052475|nr:tRNA lysidine(34) synthetase TilS [Lacticaseibacillus thailandensis]